MASSPFWRLPLLLLLGIPFTAWCQQPLLPRDSSQTGPQTFALILGISKYKYVRPLTYADKDAELFRDFLRSPGGGSVKDENIFCLLNEKALHSTFWTKGFQWLRAKQPRKDDRLFIYLAGHGDAIDEDQYFFLGYDCNPAGDKNNYLVGGAIQLYNLKKKIAAETQKGVKVFLVMDACRSNELPGGTAGLEILNTAISEKKAGEVMMLATGAGQESLEDASIGSGHGLFTWYLVDGLSGMADTPSSPDGSISLNEIRNYVEQNVPAQAQDRFKRRQQPFFCCDEYGQEVISQVDPGYLKKWLEQKAKYNRGGNSFYGETNPLQTNADTLLLQIYQRFQEALDQNRLSGEGSAEAWYAQLESQFPGTPYTEDARTSLAASFIHYAQQQVNQFLSCNWSPGSQKEQSEAGRRLQRAIKLIEADEPDFAASLRSRSLLLQSAGNPPGTAEAFRLAWDCQRISPGAAFIDNWLSRLHQSANNRDSALYYAERASRLAPKWPCALLTLSQLRQKEKGKDDKKSSKKWPSGGPGLLLGGGMNRSAPDFSGNPNTGITAMNARSTGNLQAGLFYQWPVGGVFSIRPSASFILGTTEIRYSQRPAVGGELIQGTLLVEKSQLQVSFPVLLRLPGKKVFPYLVAGPSLQNSFSTSESLPVKKMSFSADGGVGMEIPVANSGVKLCPELKYTAGLTDRKDAGGNTVFSNSISGLRRNGFSLVVYIRK